jgi:F-type H+-transporting ATPase subunit beta
VSRHYPTARHERLADRCRQSLRKYQEWDPDLGLRQDPGGDLVDAATAQALIRFLVQPYHVAEPFTSLPGESTSHKALLRSLEEIMRE